MKTYLVQTTNHALKDMNDLYEYIAVNLQAPENAMGQYNRIAEAIETLSYMPERIKLVDAEPWKSRGMHRMSVDHYSVFFFIREENVIITDILYSASDIEARLRGKLRD